MRPFKAGADAAPTPEDLTAYVDEQLEAARRTSVEAWLRGHPEAAAEIEGQRRLARLWQATTPAEPESAMWASLLARLQDRCFGSRSARPHPRWLMRAGGIAGLAATLLLTLFWQRATGPVEDPAAGRTLTIVSPDDVEIVSLRAADRGTLVVGVPPVTGTLVLASAADVEFEGIEPAADGMVPEVHMDEATITPMIVAPLEATGARASGNAR
jgi:anti-sigma factor RsiW